MLFGFHFDPRYALLMVRRLVTLNTPSIIAREIGGAVPGEMAQEMLLNIAEAAFYAADSFILLWAASRFARALRVTGTPFIAELNFWVEYRLFPVLDWPWIHWFKTSE